MLHRSTAARRGGRLAAKRHAEHQVDPDLAKWDGGRMGTGGWGEFRMEEKYLKLVRAKVKTLAPLNKTWG